MNFVWLVLALPWQVAPQPAPPQNAPKAGDAKPADAKPANGDGKNPAKDPAKDPAAVDKALAALDQNQVVAAVNGEVVTLRDVLLQWKLDGRATTDPDRNALPTVEQVNEIKKDIVTSRLWLSHARLYPLYGEVITQQVIDDEAKQMFAPLLLDPTLTEDEKKLIRRRAEESIAQQFILFNDPEFKRASVARPTDVERWWESHPELHRRPARAQLERVVLGRELLGPKVEQIAKDLRQRAIELQSLEAAAKELAPGSYSPAKEITIEGKSDLRDDVIEFARTARPGDLSAPIVGQASIMIFGLASREDGHDVTFEEAAPRIKTQLENWRQRFRVQEYLVMKILPEAFFLPGDLFDDEIERFLPGYTKNRKEQAPKPAPADAGKR